MQQRLDGFRRFHLAAGCAFLSAGLFVLVYRGPGWRFTRGTLGDLFVVGFLYHLLSLFWRGPARLVLAPSPCWPSESNWRNGRASSQRDRRIPW
jgi:hypothetical protein